MYPIKSISKAVLPPMRIAQILKGPLKTPGLQKFHTKQLPSMYPGYEKSQISQEPSSKEATSISRAINTAKAKPGTSCSYPTTHIPNQQHTKEQHAKLSLFDSRIKDLWKKIWFGLYQVEGEGEDEIITHATQIRKLYASAGMAGLLRQPGRQDANAYFRGHWEFIGLGKLSEVLVESGPTDSWPVIGRLKVYEGMASENMQSISLLLKEYEQQVYNVSELYRFLECMQISESYYGGQPDEGHVQAVMCGFRERAGGIVMALKKLDLEMGALQRDIKKEALMLHGRLDGAEMLHFKEEVLKP
ncbi:hypothetical protein DPV78_008498 [Talaromyces pinophilus]|nr:hypothetical protein DPV78_008498 [Talaromyces pinophilus]